MYLVRRNRRRTARARRGADARSGEAAPTDRASIIPSVKLLLLIGGAAFELFGIVLIAAPDLVPGARRAGAWLSVRTQREVDRLRLAIRRPRHQVVQVPGLAHARAMGNPPSVRISVNADASLDEKVAYLLSRDQDAQRVVNDLAGRVAAIETQLPGQLATLRDEMRTHVAAELAASEADYRPARIGGTIALAIGLVLVTVANFV
jgi:hypothetical protein